MFLKLVKSQLKIFVRDKMALFWSSIFAIILALFFKVALADLGYDYILDTMPVAYINMDNKTADFETFNNAFKDLENDNKKLFDFIDVKSDEEAKELLRKGEVEALIDVSTPNFDLVVNDSGIKQTIITSIVNTYQQNSHLIKTKIAQDPTADLGEFFKTLSQDADYFKKQNNDHFDLAVLYFYSLLGMQCLYAYNWGIVFVSQNEANLSTKGQRVQVSGVKKSLLIASGFFSAVLLAFIQNMIFFLFLKHFIGINFGDKIGYIILLLLVGSTTGVSFGSLIASSNQKSENFKDGLGIGITMMWSFMSGMMMVKMKHIIQQSFPFFNYTNPVSLILDGLYSLYYFPTMDRYFTSLGILTLITTIFIGLTIFFSRRKQYDAL